VLYLSNHSIDCHHIRQESSIGDVFLDKLVKYKMFMKCNLAATAIL
jgi:hypothetical protein